MFELFGGKTIRRDSKNAATSSNKKIKRRGVSKKAPRGKRAPTKSTKQKRQGRKHGGRTSQNNVPAEDFPEIAKLVMSKSEKNNLQTPEKVAAVIHKKYLKHKKPKEKANFLNGLARDVGKNPGRYGIGTTIILMAIYVAFFHYNLGGYITSSTGNLINRVFPGKQDKGFGPSAFMMVLTRQVEHLVYDKDYEKLAKLVIDYYHAAEYLVRKQFRSKREYIYNKADDVLNKIFTADPKSATNIKKALKQFKEKNANAAAVDPNDAAAAALSASAAANNEEMIKVRELFQSVDNSLTTANINEFQKKDIMNHVYFKVYAFVNQSSALKADIVNLVSAAIKKYTAGPYPSIDFTTFVTDNKLGDKVDVETAYIKELKKRNAMLEHVKHILIAENINDLRRDEILNHVFAKVNNFITESPALKTDIHQFVSAEIENYADKK